MTAGTDGKTSTRVRASRSERARDRGFRAQDRDVDVLLALAKMRLLRTSDLTRLFFEAKGTCQKRLRKLFDAGLVRSVVGDLATENRYALTPMGHAFLVEAVDDVPSWRPVPPVRGRELVHLDLLNRYRIALATSVGQVGGELVAFTPDWELRGRSPRAPLFPDAAVVLDLRGRRLEVAVESDTGSMPPTVVAKKVAAYLSVRLLRTPVFGLVAPLILFVTPTARRARSVARGLRDAGADDIVLLGTAPFVFVDGGLQTGLAKIRDLCDRDGDLGAEHFAHGLVGTGHRDVSISRSRAEAGIRR
ncbi:MAG: replication-relaxation family protein [Polyangiales bacterium]